jgi:hypothetical protein
MQPPASAADPVTIFINEAPIRVRRGLPAAEAAVQFDPQLADAFRLGTAYLTDGRGIRLAGDDPVSAGAIIRVIRRTRPRQDEADALP